MDKALLLIVATSFSFTAGDGMARTRDGAPHPVHVYEGDDALITCVARSIGNNSVVWKKEDLDTKRWKVLTAGHARVTLDQRISVLHDDGGVVWVLAIKNVRHNDSGLFACEVNSNPVVRSYHKLSVLSTDLQPPSQSAPDPSPDDSAEVSVPKANHNYTSCCIASNVSKACLGFCNIQSILDGETGQDPENCEMDFPAIVRCMADIKLVFPQHHARSLKNSMPELPFRPKKIEVHYSHLTGLVYIQHPLNEPMSLEATSSHQTRSLQLSHLSLHRMAPLSEKPQLLPTPEKSLTQPLAAPRQQIMSSQSEETLYSYKRVLPLTLQPEIAIKTHYPQVFHHEKQLEVFSHEVSNPTQERFSISSQRSLPQSSQPIFLQSAFQPAVLSQSPSPQQSVTPRSLQSVLPQSPSSLQPVSPRALQSVIHQSPSLLQPVFLQSLQSVLPQSPSSLQPVSPRALQSVIPQSPSLLQPVSPQSLQSVLPQSLQPVSLRALQTVIPQSPSLLQPVSPRSLQSVLPQSPSSLQPVSPRAQQSVIPQSPSLLRPVSPQSLQSVLPQSLQPVSPRALQSVIPQSPSLLQPVSPQSLQSVLPQSPSPLQSVLL